MFGWRLTNGIAFPVRWDTDVVQDINKTYVQGVPITGKDQRCSLKALVRKYPYSPPAVVVSKPILK